jgi:hypothetical protein
VFAKTIPSTQIPPTFLYSEAFIFHFGPTAHYVMTGIVLWFGIAIFRVDAAMPSHSEIFIHETLGL